jgi:hypothetical protein
MMVVAGDYLQGVVIEILVICFQVKNATGGEEHFVAVEEDRSSEAFSFFAGLGVGEGDPYFRDLSGAEEFGYMVYLGSYKGNVLHLFFLYCSGATPKSGAFEVNSDEILSGIFFCQSDRVFAFTATQFKNNRIFIKEKILMPFGTESEIIFNFVKVWLEKVGESKIFPEVNKLLFGHRSSYLVSNQAEE